MMDALIREIASDEPLAAAVESSSDVFTVTWGAHSGDNVQRFSSADAKMIDGLLHIRVGAKPL